MHLIKKMTNKNKTNKQNTKQRKKKLKKFGKTNTSIVLWRLLVLLQVLPLAQENEEGVPIDNAQ